MLCLVVSLALRERRMSDDKPVSNAVKETFGRDQHYIQNNGEITKSSHTAGSCSFTFVKSNDFLRSP
jgi:hypothetical protein